MNKIESKPVQDFPELTTFYPSTGRIHTRTSEIVIGNTRFIVTSEFPEHGKGIKEMWEKHVERKVLEAVRRGDLLKDNYASELHDDTIRQPD